MALLGEIGWEMMERVTRVLLYWSLVFFNYGWWVGGIWIGFGGVVYWRRNEKGKKVFWLGVKIWLVGLALAILPWVLVLYTPVGGTWAMR